MTIYNFIAVSYGGNSFGLGGFEIDVTIDMPFDDVCDSDIDWFKQKIKEMFEEFDVDIVFTSGQVYNSKK